MTAAQMAFVFAVLVLCCLALIWMWQDARQPQPSNPVKKIDDSGQNAEMLAKVKDRFSLAVYRKVYNIGDEESDKPEGDAGDGSD